MRIALVTVGTLALLGTNGRDVRDEEGLGQYARVRAAFLGGVSSDVLPSNVDDDVSREEELAVRKFYDIFNGVVGRAARGRNRAKIARPRGAPIAAEIGDVAMTPEEVVAERLALAKRGPNKVCFG